LTLAARTLSLELEQPAIHNRPPRAPALRAREKRDFAKAPPPTII
jgi:hypothetical protein